MSFVRSLQLHAFRNYRDTSVTDLAPGFVVLTGQNGVGKTNILEAVSLLSPGRGLRTARMADLRNRMMPEGVPWSIASVVETPVGDVKIGTGCRDERRIARVNGVDLKAQADLSEYVTCVWLTPQMDGLFLDAASERRRFFDRLVYAFDPAHAGRVTRYESVMSQRSKILKMAREQNAAPDAIWLSSLEATMAETGVAIAAARVQSLQSLSAHLDVILKDSAFPVSNLVLGGGIEEALQSSPALEVEDRIRARLEDSRRYDGENGGASIGPHRTDLQVTYKDRNMPAAHCSTGEQKALLTGIVLAHAVRTAEVRDAAPILLLDEVAAHLDEKRRGSLFGILHELKAQVFLTGTDHFVFANLPQARHLMIASDMVREAA